MQGPGAPADGVRGHKAHGARRVRVRVRGRARAFTEPRVAEHIRDLAAFGSSLHGRRGRHEGRPRPCQNTTICFAGNCSSLFTLVRSTDIRDRHDDIPLGGRQWGPIQVDCSDNQIFCFVSGSIPPRKEGSRCILEDLQHPLHRWARCPRRRIPENTERNQ